MSTATEQAIEALERICASIPTAMTMGDKGWSPVEVAQMIRKELAALRSSPAEPVACIKLRPAEVQGNLDRVKWAEGLIRQLPATHDGRNSWLLNYEGEKHTADKGSLYAHPPLPKEASERVFTEGEVRAMLLEMKRADLFVDTFEDVAKRTGVDLAPPNTDQR